MQILSVGFNTRIWKSSHLSSRYNSFFSSIRDHLFDAFFVLICLNGEVDCRFDIQAYNSMCLSHLTDGWSLTGKTFTKNTRLDREFCAEEVILIINEMNASIDKGWVVKLVFSDILAPSCECGFPIKISDEIARLVFRYLVSRQGWLLKRSSKSLQTKRNLL